MATEGGSKLRVLLTIMIGLAVVAVAGYLVYRYVHNPRLTGKSAVSAAPTLPSVPGAGNASNTYVQSQLQQNRDEITQARRTGGDAVPTITRGSFRGNLTDFTNGTTTGAPVGCPIVSKVGPNSSDCKVDALQKARNAGLTPNELRCQQCSCQNLRAAGFSAASIKDSGFTANQMRTCGFTLKSLLAAGYSAAELKKAGFSAGQLRAAGFSAAQLKAAGYSLNDLRNAGYSAAALRNAGFTAKQLKAAGYTASQLAGAGFTAGELQGAGFSPAAIAATGLKQAGKTIGICTVANIKTDRANGISATDLRQHGCSLSQLRQAGYTAAQLRAAGYSAKDLRAAGFTAAQLKAAGYTPKQLAEAGYSAAQLRALGYSAEQLKDAGFNAQQLRAAGFTAGQLKSAGFSAKELKAAGYTAASLRDAGFSAKELAAAGFTPAELAAGGFTPQELREANLTPAQLKAAGLTQGQLLRAGFGTNEVNNTTGIKANPACSVDTLARARMAGKTALQMKALGCTPHALRAAGYTAAELKAAGYTAAELKNAGFTPTQLQHAGFSAAQAGATPTGQNDKLAGINALAQGTAASSGIQRLQALRHLQEQEASREQRANMMAQMQAQMQAQSQQLMSAWSHANQQAYVKATPTQARSGGQASGNSYTQTVGGGQGRSGQSAGGGPVYKAGTVMFAVLDTSINSDMQTPILATIVSGPLKGAKLIGQFQRMEDHLLVNFNRLNIANAEHTQAISAVAIDPNTARTAITGNVNYHTLLRYGSLFASAFLEGYGNALQSQGTTIAGPITVHVSQNLSFSEQLMAALGNVGTQYAQVMGNNFNKPPTVKIPSGTAIGVLIMSDLTLNDGAAGTTKQAVR